MAGTKSWDMQAVVYEDLLIVYGGGRVTVLCDPSLATHCQMELECIVVQQPKYSTWDDVNTGYQSCDEEDL